MMKFLVMLLMMFMMINKMNFFFVYNLLFLMLVMFAMNMYDMNLEILISGYMSMGSYSFMLIMLSVWVIGLMMMTLNDESKIKMNMFLGLLIILYMFFLVKNVLIFYMFFELSLIPIFMIVIYWGYNPERMESSYYMLMYTLMISLPLLIYIFMMYKDSGSLSMMLIKLLSIKYKFWGMMIIFGAFMIKMPIYMCHIWLPKAHVEAPVYGSMVLAAVLLKLGSYGLMQVMIMLYESSIKVMNLIISVGLIGSLVISFICLMQVDMKSLVAYSSVVHMNLVLCGLMSLFKMGFMSAYIIMISHGLCSSGLFFMVNLYYYQSSSRLMLMNKGMMNIFPSFSVWWFLLCVSNFSFPLSVGFISEIYFLGVMIKLDLLMILYLIMISFVSSAYSLYLYLYVQQGEMMMSVKLSGESLKDFLIMMMHFFPLMLILMNLLVF